MLLSKYNNSILYLLSKLFPEQDWLPWKSPSCPPSYWDNVNNQRKFLEWAKTELKIKNNNDWYKKSEKVKEISVKFLIY